MLFRKVKLSSWGLWFTHIRNSFGLYYCMCNAGHVYFIPRHCVIRKGISDGVIICHAGLSISQPCWVNLLTSSLCWKWDSRAIYVLHLGIVLIIFWPHCRLPLKMMMWIDNMFFLAAHHPEIRNLSTSCPQVFCKFCKFVCEARGGRGKLKTFTLLVN